MEYNFLGYDRCIFDHAFSMLDREKSLILVESFEDLPLCRRKNFEHFSINDNVIMTKEEFKEMIFLKEKLILKGDARLITFFKSLSENHKTRFKINNIFDCIDFGNRFFRLQEELIEERKIKEHDLYEWQKEVFSHLENIKQDYRDYLYKRGLEDKIFVYNPARVDLEKIKFKKIICMNLISLSRLERYIFQNIASSGVEVKMFLQIEEENYDKDNMEIRDVTIPAQLPYIQIRESSDNLMQSIEVAKDLGDARGASAIINVNQDSEYYLEEIKNISLKNCVLFKDTELYNFLNDLMSMLENVKIIEEQVSLSISDLLKAQSSTYFSKYYNFSPKEQRSITTLVKAGYKYIPKGFGICQELYEDLSKILKIDSFDDFYRHFAKNSFAIFKNENYENLFETFYNSLLEMQALTKNVLENKWKNIFSKRKLSPSLLRFFLNNLKFRRVKLASENLQYKAISILENGLRENLFILNFDERSLSLKGKTDFFLTDDQRKRLKLKDNKLEYLENKYRYLRAVASSKKCYIYYIKNPELGLETSSLLEEIRLKRNIRITSSFQPDDHPKAAYDFFRTEANCKLEDEETDSLPMHRRDLIENREFSIGFYDYNELTKCGYKYYLKSIAKIHPQEFKVIYRIDPNLLGNMIHDILNEIAILKRDSVKVGDFFVSSKDVSDILAKIVEEEKFKIPENYQRYYEKILFPFIVKGVVSFYKSLSVRLKGERITEFLAEESEKRVIDEVDGVFYVIKGKADLRIETDKRKYVIDYKTGHSDAKQLDFYHILYYDDDLNVVKWFYKFFDEIIKEETAVNVFKEEIKINMNKLISNRYYARTTDRGICKYCEYIKICKIRGI